MATYCGGCQCGGVRFSYEGPSLWCAHCHCTMCQRAHGAPLVTWVGVADDRFHIGQAESLRWYHSSATAERGFCSSCGSPLFFRAERFPGEIHVARAAIEGDIDRAPSAHVYTDSQPDWFRFEDALPRE